MSGQGDTPHNPPKVDWKKFNDLLELAIKASALSFTEDEWMWLVGCLRAAEDSYEKDNG